MTLNATDNAAKLQSEQAASSAANLYALAVKKLVAGVALSSDEYRSLGAGCAGMETDRTFFQKIGRVSVVYPGSPADQAGIRVGDKVIQNDNDEQAKADPTKPLWEVQTGQAGTPVDITLLRHGKPVTLTLIRMNIEDIQDPEVRQTWERMISNLGYPKEGTFIAPSLRGLEGR
jgi:C-terminal processing protease CtpA/Prc